MGLASGSRLFQVSGYERLDGPGVQPYYTGRSVYFSLVSAALLAASRRPERASIVSLATEGLWVLELLGLSPLSPAERERVVAELLRLAEEAT
jgi:hypothetical protein